MTSRVSRLSGTTDRRGLWTSWPGSIRGDGLSAVGIYLSQSLDAAWWNRAFVAIWVRNGLVVVCGTRLRISAAAQWKRALKCRSSFGTQLEAGATTPRLVGPAPPANWHSRLSRSKNRRTQFPVTTGELSPANAAFRRKWPLSGKCLGSRVVCNASCRSYVSTQAPGSDVTCRQIAWADLGNCYSWLPIPITSVASLIRLNQWRTYCIARSVQKQWSTLDSCSLLFVRTIF